MKKNIPLAQKQPGILQRAHWVLVTIYFTILSLVFTYPLITKITTHIIGGYDDNLYWMWLVGWFQKSLFNLHILPIHSYLLNTPYGYNLAVTEFSPLQVMIAQPFSILSSPILGVNISLLFTFVSAGLLMYLWIYRLTKNWKAALISGSIYAFLPYHIVHFQQGQLNIAAIQWFPLYFMVFFDFLKMQKWDWKPILLTGISLGLIALTSQYYIYMTLWVSAFIALIYWIKYDRSLILHADFWKKVLAVLVVALPFLVVGVGPFLRLHGEGNFSAYGFNEVAHFSASITDYLLPATRQWLLGSWVGHHFPRQLWTEATLYIGVFAAILAILGVIKRNQTNHKQIITLMLWGGLLALILSFGTNLVWMEKPVMINTPAILSSLVKEPTMPVYLPGFLLFKFFPFYNKIRAWMRWGIFVMLFIALAAGFGADWLMNKLTGYKRNLVFIALLSLVILDFLPNPATLVKIAPRSVDYWLAGQPSGGQVQLPFDESYSTYNIYYTLTNNKPLVSQINPILTNRYFVAKPVYDHFPDQESVNLLHKDKIRYVLLDDDYFPDQQTLISQCQALGLRFAIDLNGISVFVVETAP